MPSFSNAAGRTGDFRAATRRSLAERAAHLCSNPYCGQLTIGPAQTDSALVTRIGFAAHICAAARGGPRYDVSQTPTQRSGIANGIWLCGSCASMIDKNDGVDYPVKLIRQWKADHERAVKPYLEGRRRIRLVGEFGDDEKAAALLDFLQDRGVLFQPWEYEHPEHVVESTKEIRNYATALIPALDRGSPLHVAATSIRAECREFMNRTSATDDPACVRSALGALRKAVSLTVRDLAASYHLRVDGPLGDVLTE